MDKHPEEPGERERFGIMEFGTWLRLYTGLTVYDFFALTWGEFTHKKTCAEVDGYLREWIRLKNPSVSAILRAEADIAEWK